MKLPRKTPVRPRLRLATGVLGLLLAGAGAAAAQGAKPTAPREPSHTTLAEGWRALAAGELAIAERAAAQAMRDSGGSLGAITLAIEVDIAAGRQTVPGLAAYEGWLGARVVEGPYLLRRVAQAHLRQVVRQPQHPGRHEAARLLTDDGDPALPDMLPTLGNGDRADARLLAAAGDERGVKALIAQLQIPGGGQLGIIDALARSGSRLAVAPLMRMLDDQRMDHRAAAADGLGRLGASEAAPRLKPLLEDPAFPIRMAAASALYRLEDYSGVQFLEQLLSSEHPAVRLAAAEVLAIRADGAWLPVARSLVGETDETVRLGAARLLAPHDPVLAAQTLHGLAHSENPVVREEAERLFVARVSADFAGLRRALRSPDGVTSVRAAGRILELTR
jgi:HEAT repeat protein